MNRDDNNLNKLLKQWREIEPASNFEAGVWRRIRQAEAGRPVRASLLEQWWRSWLWRPALGMAAAVIFSAVIGTSMGVHAAPRRTTAATGELQFMSAGTLAGGYARLAAEGAR
jgi:hypothetical protein